MAKAQGKVGANQADVFLAVDVLDPQKVAEKWIAKLVVHVGLRGHQNYQDCPLTLFLDGRDLGIDAETDQNGSYAEEVELPGPGSYLIGAAIRDTNIKAAERRKVTVENVSTKTPARIKVIAVGPRGKQQLLISGHGEDGGVIIGVKGIILDDAKIIPFSDPKVEKLLDGSMTYQAKFREVRRAFEVRVGDNPEQVWRTILLGPTQ